jgi:hypothetical protein
MPQSTPIEFAELKREVGELREELRAVRALLDPEEIAAALRLRYISPSDAELKRWSEASEGPEDLVDQQEERIVVPLEPDGMSGMVM